MSTASATDGGTAASVCPSGDGWYKTELRGEQTSFTHTAPAGYMITAVCAKSASFLGLFQQTLDPAVKSYTFTSAASGFGTKALSHVSVKKEKITTPTTPAPADCTSPATPKPGDPTTCETPTTPPVTDVPDTDVPDTDVPDTDVPDTDVPVVLPTEGVDNPDDTDEDTDPVVVPSEETENGNNPNGQPDSEPTVKGVDVVAGAPAAVPTAVDAGVLTPGSDDTNRALTLMVLGTLLAVAGAVFGLAPARRKGKFQH